MSTLINDDAAGELPEVESYGDPGACDVCGRPLCTESFYCDAELPARGGIWGVLCKTCTQSEGIRAGWGRAQFYERCVDPEEPQVLRWRCVAGRPPADVLRD
jgi:hypothetical protein